jgi:hypothetical protein
VSYEERTAGMGDIIYASVEDMLSLRDQSAAGESVMALLGLATGNCSSCSMFCDSHPF